MKRVILILSIALASLSACQPDYTGWLSQVPDSEELSKKPIKPVPQEIPITRPELSSVRNEWMEVADGVNCFSWKLFRQYYQQQQNNVLIAPYNMLNNLNKKVGKMGELAQTRLLKLMNIEEDLMENYNEYFKDMEFHYSDPDFLFAATRMSHDYEIEQNGSVNHLLSFHGFWSVTFDSHETQKAIFHKADGSEKEIDMMYTKVLTYYYAIREFTIVRVHLRGLNYQMFFILPNEGFCIDDVISSFHPYLLRTQSLGRVHLWMPKFSVHDSQQLDANIIELLSANAFDLDDETQENPDEGLIKQDCFLGIDEIGLTIGTEIKRDITSSYWYGYAAPIYNFRLDRPFVYGISYSNIYPLFLGYYGY